MENGDVLHFRKRADVRNPGRLAVLPGTYNPPTVAHVALAEEAAGFADEVLLLLPERLPHKGFEDARFEARLSLLERVATNPRMTVASAPGGLFLEIAEHCAATYPGAEIAIVCGRDAAERILSWPYEDQSALDRLFALAKLWVYARNGAFHAGDTRFGEGIRAFDFDENLQRISASEVRRRIRQGEEWRFLVPEAIQEEVERLYR